MKNEHIDRPVDTTSDDGQQPAGASTEAVDRDFVTALARGLDVLRCYCGTGGVLGPTEVAQKSGLPKSTVTRLIHTLTKLEYLTFVPESGKYRLGPSMLALNTATPEQLDIRQIARPLMQELASATGAQVALAVRDRLSILYLEICRGQSIVTLNLTIGSRIPLAVTAGGRAYLAGLPANERADLLEQIRNLDEIAWQKIAPGIDRAMKEYAETGCCSSMGDWTKPVHGIAAPLNLGSGLPRMVLSIAGVSDVYPGERMFNEIRPMLLDVSRKIEAFFGQRS